MNRLRALVAARPRLSFVVLNLLLAGASLLWLGRDSAAPVGAWIAAAVVVPAAAGPFLRARSRWRQSAVLYLGFVLFCWSFTLFDVADHLGEVTSIGDLPASLAGLVLRGFAFVLFGHLFGAPSLAVALLANLLAFPPRREPPSPDRLARPAEG